MKSNSISSFSREPGLIFLLLFLLCFSLDVQAPISFYGTQFLGLSFLLVIRLLIYPKISEKSLKIFFSAFVFLEILCFIQFQYIQQNILVLVYQKVIFLLSVSILMYDFLIRTKEKVLKKAISIYITFMSSIVILQFLGFYVFNFERTFLDFGLLLGGEESRNWYVGDWLYRPTGITSEPSIFIGIQFGLLTIQYLIDKKARMSRIIGVFSLALSMSFLGLILAALYLIIFYSSSLKNYIVGFFILLLFYFYSFELINERLTRLGSGEDGGNNIKLDAFNYFLSDPAITFFGYGFLFPSEGSPQFYDALLDLTFYLNTITVFGVFLGSILLLLFFYFLMNSRTSMKERVLICLSLVKLSSPAYLFFSCFMILSICILKNRKYK